MKFIKISIILLVFMVACRPCKHEVIDLGPISDELLNSIPYQAGEYVSFKHSNGHNIIFSVKRETKQEIFYDDHRCCKEVLYEVNTTTLSPNYPIFKFELSISNADSLHNPLSVRIGRFGFMIPDSISEWEPLDIADSLMINGVNYENVYRMKYYDYSYQDDLIYVDSLFYNKDFGILKVLMSNGENYMLNE